MKKLKRLYVLILTFALIMGLGVPAKAAVEDTGFSDVAADAEYAAAVIWCRENGLMDGVGGGRFSPEGTLTRACWPRYSTGRKKSLL